NPCPCGYYNHPEKECICGSATVHRYLSKISGPLLDRIDLHVEVTPVAFSELVTSKNTETSEIIRQRVVRSQKIQAQRFASFDHIHNNAQMNTPTVRQVCHV